MTEKKYSYLAKNTMLFTISSFGSKILTFFLVPFYTRVLTTEEYGIADLIQTTAYLLIYIFTINIADSVLRFAIERKEKSGEILSYGIKVLICGSCILGGCLLFTASLHLITFSPEYIVLLFLVFVSIALNQVLSNYLRAIDKITDVAISGIMVTAVTIACNLFFLLYLQTGLSGYLLSIVLGHVTSCIYCLWKSGLSFLGMRCPKNIKRAMCYYSIPLVFNGVAWWMNSSIDKYFVAWMLGASVNGLLAVANKIPTVLSLFQSIFAQAWNLSAIREFNANDEDGFFSKTYTIYNAGMVLVCSILILLNILISRMLFSDAFFEAWKYSSVLLLAGLFCSLSGFCGSIFTAVKNSKIFATSTVIAALINIILNGIFIKVWGLQGAVIATAISFFTIWLIRLVNTYKYISWKLNIKKDCVAYILLILQIVFEHMDKYTYLGQVIILILLFVLYHDVLKEILKPIMQKWHVLIGGRK